MVPRLFLAGMLLFAACRPPQPTDREPAMPDTLPFTLSVETHRTLDPAAAAAEARRIAAAVEAEPAAGLQLSLWATEQLIEDPIALEVADNGDVYVTGSARTGGLLDIRGHMQWAQDALALETVHEHERFLKHDLSPERSDQNPWLPDYNEDGSHDWRDLTIKEDRLYRLNDTDGDGVADLARTVTRGFNTVVHDLLGGLEIHDGSIYLSAAPGLYRLDHALGDGPAQGRTLSWGYNVHPGFNGHGMSGVTVGPDGRIYWAVGDMGLRVIGPDGTVHEAQHQGAILRAFPDGSGFEVFARGLRNTHEFVFDDRGNLISVDNDGDHPGEMERIVYIVEGSDSGWRVHWQFGKYTDERNNAYKVWMDEEYFKPRFDDQAAFITPPISNYHSGPAGMAYNPGTALGPTWRDAFFISEYTGSPATTNVHAFWLEPSGAGFDLAEERVAVSGILTVGLGFGPDGALYLADWIDGWRSKGTGRVWKLDVDAPDASVRTQTRELLAADFSAAAEDELVRHLEHPDLRVRRKAQFELAERGEVDGLLQAARRSANLTARLHGLWGLWQLALQDAESDVVDVLRDEFLADDEAEIRAQAAKILGDVRAEEAAEALVPLLRDASERVRFFAAEALGRVEHRPAFNGLVALLADAGDDTYLRHAGSLALARLDDPEAVRALASHDSEAVRLAGVVALRRMKHEGAADFLDDPSERVVTEAARAINDDGGIEPALPALAALLGRTPFDGEPLVRRVLSANLRVGTAEAARRVAAFAQRADGIPALRAEAVDILGVWPAPSTLDRVDGAYLGRVRRDTSVAREALAPVIGDLLGAEPAPVRRAAATAARRLLIEEAAATLAERLRSDADGEVRRAAFDALLALRTADDAEAMEVALMDAGIRMHALRQIAAAELDQGEAAALLQTALEEGTREERQSALAALSDVGTSQAQAVLGRQLAALEAGSIERELHLDVLEAALESGSDSLAARVEAYRTQHGRFTAALYGGDVDDGERVYRVSDAANCTRCHAIGSDGVGPDLAGIGGRLSREQLLEALVEPSARIAPGFGSEGSVSAMPTMADVLTQQQIRDLVAYLASLR